MVEIVPISKKHLEGFHAALDIVAREKKYLAWFEAPSIESTRKFIMGNIKNDVPHFVALDDGTVVGWCDVIPGNRPAFAHWGILGLGLLPDYRGQGIGKKLLLTTLHKAKEQGMERVQLSVYTSNKIAISLYKQIGFKEEGVRRKVAKIDGRYEDDYIMALFFNDIEL